MNPTCPHCQNTFEPVIQGGRNVKVYCSPRCRERRNKSLKARNKVRARRARLESQYRNCVVCQDLFIPAREGTFWCSIPCYRAMLQRIARPRPRPRPAWHIEPEDKRARLRRAPREDAERRREAAERNRLARVREAECPQCGDVFTTDHPLKKFCSKGCQERYKSIGSLIAAGSIPKHKPGTWHRPAQKNAVAPGERVCEVDGCTRKHAAKGFCINHYNQWRRASGLVEAPGSRWPSKRAEYWGVEYESINAAEVYASDGFVCQLCGGLVDVTRFHPDPLSPSLDHVVPMSKGGPHLRSNVQTAHLGCNISKGNRVEVGAA